MFFVFTCVRYSPHIVNMLPSHDNSVKLIPLLAQFLVYVHLERSRALQPVPRAMQVDHAKNVRIFYSKRICNIIYELI